MAAQWALVTGASAGIGEQLARGLAARGYDLVLVARRVERLESLANALRASGRQVVCVAQDLAVEGAVAQVVRVVAEQGVVIEVLVNNAGRGHWADFVEVDEAIDAQTLHLNVMAVTALMHAFLPGMVARGGGRVLNIASIAGFLPGPGMAVYNASKAYVLSLSEAVNAELCGSGVTVTASCPGPTRSEFFELAGSDKMENLRFVRMMSARTVAEQAIDATLAGEPVIVHGLANKAMALSPRFLPRRWVPGIVRRLMK